MVQAWHLGTVSALLFLLATSGMSTSAEWLESYMLTGSEYALAQAEAAERSSFAAYLLAVVFLGLAAFTWHRGFIRREVAKALTEQRPAPRPGPPQS